MAMDAERAYRRIQRVGEMPYGVARSRAALELVDLIREEGPAEAFNRALVELIDAYCYGNQTEKAYVPFTELVAWLDEHPEHNDSADIHNACWAFRMMVRGLMSYPNITKQQIEQGITDLERHYRAAGIGLEPASQIRFDWADQMGSPEAPALYRAWLAEPRTKLSNCELCQPIDRADYLARQGDPAAAIGLLEETFATLDVTAFPHCFQQPFGGYILLAHLYGDRGQAGDQARSREMYFRALGHIEEYGSGPQAIGRTFLYAARARQADQALRLLKQFGPRGLRETRPWMRLKFLTTLAATARILDHDLGLGTTAVDLAGTPATNLAELGSWAEAEARQLAAAFDARNETQAVSRRQELAMAWPVWPEPIDLTVIPDQSCQPATAGMPETTLDAGKTGPAENLGETEPAKATTPAPGELLARAEDTSRGPAERVQDYLGAARGYEATGELTEAGFAWAEAGVLARQLGDFGGAVQALDRGQQILRAVGELPVGLHAPVTQELALALADHGDYDRALAVADQLTSDLATLSDDDSVKIKLTMTADLARATILSQASRHQDAVGYARQAGEAAAARGDYGSAARAFLLAGQALVAAGDDSEALWYLESAVEGATYLRQKPVLAEMIDPYVAALRRLGRDAEAEAALDQL